VRRRGLATGAAALCGFVLAFGAFVLLTWPIAEDCSGSGCELAFVAVLTWEIIWGF
jgi:hypothetical protein